VPEKRTRRSIRLPGYDYASSGAYFVTICAYQRKLLFADLALQAILNDEWKKLPERFPATALDAFVVMPNHVHFILWLNDPNRSVAAPLAGARGPQPDSTPQPRDEAGASPAPTLGNIVGAYKSLVAVRWLRLVQAERPTATAHVWQRNYYERIIRNDVELNRIREYIAYNPTAWQQDRENPDRVKDNRHLANWGWIEDTSSSEM